MSVTLGPIYARPDYAGFLRRTAALLVDGGLIYAVYVGLPWVWYYCAPSAWVTQRAYYSISVATLVLGLAYLLGMRMTDGGTLGYRLMGIRYAYMLGPKAPVLMRVYRAFWAVFLLWFFLLDHFWILFDGRKQAWHDKLSGFYVVRRKARPVGMVPMQRRLVNFASLSLLVFEPADATD